MLIFDRDVGCCWFCGTVLDPRYHVDCFDPGFHVEHLTPRCRGGGDEPDNLRAACANCNITKGARTVLEFREYIQQYADLIHEEFQRGQRPWPGIAKLVSHQGANGRITFVGEIRESAEWWSEEREAFMVLWHGKNATH